MRLIVLRHIYHIVLTHAKNIVSVQVKIRFFPLYKSIDGYETNLLDREFFDGFRLLNLTMNFIKGHRLGIIFCFANLISICKFQRNIKLTIFTMDGIVIITFQYCVHPSFFRNESES